MAWRSSSVAHKLTNSQTHQLMGSPTVLLTAHCLPRRSSAAGGTKPGSLRVQPGASQQCCASGNPQEGKVNISRTSPLGPSANVASHARSQEVIEILKGVPLYGNSKTTNVPHYYPRQEPGALVAHAGIRAGGAGQPAFLPRRFPHERPTFHNQPEPAPNAHNCSPCPAKLRSLRFPGHGAKHRVECRKKLTFLPASPIHTQRNSACHGEVRRGRACSVSLATGLTPKRQKVNISRTSPLGPVYVAYQLGNLPA